MIIVVWCFELVVVGDGGGFFCLVVLCIGVFYVKGGWWFCVVFDGCDWC